MAVRYDLSGRPTTEEKVRRLLRAEPHWGPILRTCISVLEERGAKARNSTEVDWFAGAWVIQALHVAGIRPPNNLRTLAGIGLIKFSTTTRGGNRAYYTIPDAKEITNALKRFHY